MRSFLLLLVFLVGCSKEQSRGYPAEGTALQIPEAQSIRPKAESSNTPKKQRGKATFDAADLTRTQQWLIQGFLNAMDYPAGNRLAAQKKWDDYHEELRAAEGQTVKWNVKCREVFENGSILLDVIQFHDKQRHYLLSMVFFYDPQPATPQDKPIPISAQFPAKGKSWLLKVQKGDPLILSGRIRMITADNRLERDKGTRDRPAALIWRIQFETADLEWVRSAGR